MDLPPIPAQLLVLLVEFDLSDVPGAAELPHKDHQAAAEAAATASGLWSPTNVAARPAAIDGAASVLTAQREPFASRQPRRAVEVEYFYGSDGKSLCVRVLVTLAEVDGVTSLRLAFHTLEMLEGASEPSPSSAFKKHPEFVYGWRQRLNFARMLGGTLGDYVFARLAFPLLSKRGVGGSDQIPNSPASLMAYHAKDGGKAAPAVFRAFQAAPGTSKPYRRFLSVLTAWKQRLGAVGFFVLINMSPRVIPAELTHAEDILSIEARYAGAFSRAAAPPDDSAWPLNNFYHVRRIFVNNYGRHTVAARARPTGFLWDWVGLGPAVWGAGCAEINGTFFAWMRGTDAGLDLVKGEVEQALTPLFAVKQTPKDALTGAAGARDEMAPAPSQL